MFKAVLKAVRDVMVGYAIVMTAAGIIQFARDLRDHFRKVNPQY